MAIVKKGKHQNYIESKVTLHIRATTDLEAGTEISDQEAKEMIQEELDSYACSNDGSELLANVDDEDISFE